jgi:hypothetical protein
MKSKLRKPGRYPNLVCSLCGRKLIKGEFFAAIGILPPSASVGRTDSILIDLGGKIYCRDCFQRSFESVGLEGGDQ